MGHAMKRYPEPVVGVFVRNDSDNILLVRSPKWSGGTVWTVPGGHIEMGETIAQAAVREAREEVGLDITFDRVFTVLDAVALPAFHERRHFIFIECACSVAGQPAPVIDNREIVEARWVPMVQLDGLSVQTEALRAIRELVIPA
jgi:mutator protein MutT